MVYDPTASWPRAQPRGSFSIDKPLRRALALIE